MTEVLTLIMVSFKLVLSFNTTHTHTPSLSLPLSLSLSHACMQTWQMHTHSLTLSLCLYPLHTTTHLEFNWCEDKWAAWYLLLIVPCLLVSGVVLFRSYGSSSWTYLTLIFEVVWDFSNHYRVDWLPMTVYICLPTAQTHYLPWNELFCHSSRLRHCHYNRFTLTDLTFNCYNEPSAGSLLFQSIEKQNVFFSLPLSQWHAYYPSHSIPSNKIDFPFQPALECFSWEASGPWER